MIRMDHKLFLTHVLKRSQKLWSFRLSMHVEHWRPVRNPPMFIESPDTQKFWLPFQNSALLLCLVFEVAQLAPPPPPPPFGASSWFWRSSSSSQMNRKWSLSSEICFVLFCFKTKGQQKAVFQNDAPAGEGGETTFREIAVDFPSQRGITSYKSTKCLNQQNDFGFLFCSDFCFFSLCSFLSHERQHNLCLKWTTAAASVLINPWRASTLWCFGE